MKGRLFFERSLIRILLLLFLLSASADFIESGGSGLNWRDPTCNSAILKKTGVSTCLAGRKIVFLGDSILRNMFVQLIKLFEPDIQVPTINNGSIRKVAKQTKNLFRDILPGVEKEKKNLVKFWSYRNLNHQIKVDIFYSHGTSHLEELLKLRVLQKNGYSDFVVSNALWDMGIAFRGHSRYMQALRQNLDIIKRNARPESKIILLGLHFIDTTRCLNDICRVCNDNMVQNYIREVQRKVISCTKSSIFVDSFQFT